MLELMKQWLNDDLTIIQNKLEESSKKPLNVKPLHVQEMEILQEGRLVQIRHTLNWIEDYEKNN